MKEHPILFSAPMVRAILAGTKTQTRRALRDQNPIDLGACQHGAHLSRRPVHDGGKLVGHRMVPVHCPYGEPGDRLWVRETWIPDPPIDGTWDGDIAWNGCGRRIDGVPEKYRSPKHCIFAASWDGPKLIWRPGTNMPRWASRITLDVVAVRAERLQQISKADALAEGIVDGVIPPDDYGPTRVGYMVGPDDGESPLTPTAKGAYRNLWESINGPGSWEANPWVWVVEFKRVLPGATQERSE